MKKLLLIGKMNDLMKDLNEFLQRYFRIQLCAENTANAMGMIKVISPDLILINLVGIFDMDTTIFERIQNDFPGIPVITIGTEADHRYFTKYYQSEQFTRLTRPIENTDVMDAICEILNLDKNKVKEGETIPDDGRKKVLVVDDNAQTLRTIKDMLDKKYNVSLANSGMKAMTSIGKNRPDVILLDYEMPVCDGRQTLEMIRADEDLTQIPVIFLTGVNDREHIEAVLKLMPAGYLLKPAVAEKLITAIEKAVGEKE